MATGSQILIHSPGPSTTVQDRGRFHLRRLGIPVAGTLCPDWLFLGNSLLGNAPDAAALEFRMLGPRFSIAGNEAQGIVAGPAEMRVEGPSGERTVRPWTVTSLVDGDVVSVGPVGRGTVALLCLSGGIDVPPVLGSRATYGRAKLGGYAGRALQAGDQVPLGPVVPVDQRTLLMPEDNEGSPVRVILGPQADHFADDQVDAFLSAKYSVTTQLDRMGMRLEGPPLRHLTPAMSEIVSDGIVPGAVQIPGNGQPIVLLADGQTVGGYPKIATIISADLPRLSRLAPGATVSFQAVAIAEAEAALAEQLAEFERLLLTAMPVRDDGHISLDALYESNLVSGIVNAKTSD